MNSNKKVLLGMSGGTDSSVSALLLRKQGFEVIGITLNIFEHEDQHQTPEYISDAIELSRKLGIEHIVYDAKEAFRKTVLDYFVAEYLNGRTPFPCAVCNPKIKWKILQDVADEKGCAYFATGHYAKLIEHQRRKYITNAHDKDKDQSFFLWSLNREQLNRVIFPMGHLLKEDVRKLAAKEGFQKVATKKDSLGVCFIPGGKYRPFLEKELMKRNIVIKPGDYLDASGNVIGSHKGHPFYTIGQRRGLDHGQNRVFFVNNINAKNNTIQLGDFNDLMKRKIWVKNYRFVHACDIDTTREFIVKIRYRMQATPCHIEIIDNENMLLHLHENLHSVASGQSAVLFENNRVIGGGLIDKSE